MRTSMLTDFVLPQEWLRATIKVVGAPRGLVDFATCPFKLSIGGRVSDSEDDSDSRPSESD